MEQGKPTGIKRQDFDQRAEVEFEGRPAHLYGYSTHSGQGAANVVADVRIIGGPKLILYGYFGTGGEFMELDRERVD